MEEQTEHEEMNKLLVELKSQLDTFKTRAAGIYIGIMFVIIIQFALTVWLYFTLR